MHPCLARMSARSSGGNLSPLIITFSKQCFITVFPIEAKSFSSFAEFNQSSSFISHVLEDILSDLILYGIDLASLKFPSLISQFTKETLSTLWQV